MQRDEDGEGDRGSRKRDWAGARVQEAPVAKLANEEHEVERKADMERAEKAIGTCPTRPLPHISTLHTPPRLLP